MVRQLACCADVKPGPALDPTQTTTSTHPAASPFKQHLAAGNVAWEAPKEFIVKGTTPATPNPTFFADAIVVVRVASPAPVSLDPPCCPHHAAAAGARSQLAGELKRAHFLTTSAVQGVTVNNEIAGAKAYFANVQVGCARWNGSASTAGRPVLEVVPAAAQLPAQAWGTPPSWRQLMSCPAVPVCIPNCFRNAGVLPRQGLQHPVALLPLRSFSLEPPSDLRPLLPCARAISRPSLVQGIPPPHRTLSSSPTLLCLVPARSPSREHRVIHPSSPQPRGCHTAAHPCAFIRIVRSCRPPY